MPRPPAAETISAVSSIVSGRPALWCFEVFGCVRLLRPVQYTVAPASPSMRAIPRPAPRVAPATTATFPASAGMVTSRDARSLAEDQRMVLALFDPISGRRQAPGDACMALRNDL